MPIGVSEPRAIFTGIRAQTAELWQQASAVVSAVADGRSGPTHTVCFES